MNNAYKRAKFWLYSFLIFSACFFAKQSIAQEVKDYYLLSKSLIELPNNFKDFSATSSNMEKIWVVNTDHNATILSAFSLQNDTLYSTIKVNQKLQNSGLCFAENKDLFFMGTESITDPAEVMLYILPKDSKTSVPTDSISIQFKAQLSENAAQKNSGKRFNRLIATKKRLSLLSKKSEDTFCYFYAFKTNSKSTQVKPKDSLRLTGVITGADISPDQSRMALSQTEDRLPQIIIIDKRTLETPFSGSEKRVTLSNLAGLNIKSINFIGNDTLLVVTAKNRIYKTGGYFKLALSEIEQATSTPHFEFEVARIVTTGRPGEILMIHKADPIEGPIQINLISNNGELIRKRELVAGQQKSQISLKIPKEKISPPYFVEIITPNRRIVRKVN